MIELWELKGRNDLRYSLFSWRTKMALRHKGLAFVTHPVSLTDKAAIAFSGGKTVPVIRDGDTVVRDSWAIAGHLEQQYPQGPGLFGGVIGQGLAQQFNIWVDRVIVAAMLPVIVADIHSRVDPSDEAYFRATFEKFVGKTLEEARAARPDAHKRLERAIDPLQATLKRQPFICGPAPAYADYILFSVFQWARLLSPPDVLASDAPLAAWRERLLDLHEGYARSAGGAHD